MQVTCQKTGLVFETESKRRNNHPTIMSIVNQANKDGWYSQCQDALQDGRKAGLDTLEDFLELLAQTKISALNQQMDDYRALLKRKQEDKIARIARYEAYRNGQYERTDDELDSGLEYAEVTRRNATHVAPHDMTGE